MEGFQNLFQFFRQGTQESEFDRRMRHTTELTEFVENTQLEAVKKQSKTNQTLVLTGIIMLLISIILLLPDGLISYKTLNLITMAGIGLGCISGIIALKRLAVNDLKKVQDRIAKYQNRMNLSRTKLHKPAGLYKSKRNRVVAGVAAGIADKFGIDPVVIRSLFLFMIPGTGGMMVFFYMLLALILKPAPEDYELLKG